MKLSLPIKIYIGPPLNMGLKGFKGHLRTKKKSCIMDSQNENLMISKIIQQNNIKNNVAKNKILTL